MTTTDTAMMTTDPPEITLDNYWLRVSDFGGAGERGRSVEDAGSLC